MEEQVVVVSQPLGIEFERHFSVKEIAELWNLSRNAVIDLFRDEPGVLALSREETRFKRGYTSLKIPESIVRKVHSKWRNKSRIN